MEAFTIKGWLKGVDRCSAVHCEIEDSAGQSSEPGSRSSGQPSVDMLGGSENQTPQSENFRSVNTFGLEGLQSVISNTKGRW